MTRRLALLMALCFSGCGSEGYLSHLINGPDKVPAVYTLEEQPTLILVDDPADLFNDPNIALTVAINIEFNLNQNKVLVGKTIPAREIANLQAKAGDRFKTMPVDQIGRELGAEQVLYVLIDDITMEQVPGVYRPKATVQVKVIDAAAGRRLFPNPPAPNQPPSDMPVRGHPVVTELHYKGPNQGSQGALSLLRRQLAEVLGRDIARQFYRWKPPEIGSRFEEP